MIVIAIIGILATIAIPKLTATTETAKIAKIQADVQTISTAVAVYYADKGTMPATVAALVDNTDIKSGYLQSAPKLPDGTEYAINGTTGEVTGTYKGKTYSSISSPAATA